MNVPNGKAHDVCHLDFYWPGPDSQLRCFPIWAHGLLLWRQMKNQVFQDDVSERKGEEGKDIVDLHRCQKTVF